MNPLAQVEIHRPGEAPVIHKSVPMDAALSFIKSHATLALKHASVDAYKLHLDYVIRPSSPFQ